MSQKQRKHYKTCKRLVNDSQKQCKPMKSYANGTWKPCNGTHKFNSNKGKRANGMQTINLDSGVRGAGGRRLSSLTPTPRPQRPWRAGRRRPRSLRGGWTRLCGAQAWRRPRAKPVRPGRRCCANACE